MPLNKSGRPKGAVNKITRKFRDAIQIVYENVGGDEAFTAWARENQTEFYKICARLIPTEMVGREGGVYVVVDRSCSPAPRPDTEVPAIPGELEPRSTEH